MDGALPSILFVFICFKVFPYRTCRFGNHHASLQLDGRLLVLAYFRWLYQIDPGES